MSLIEEAKELFGEMRDATPEEQECIENYLKDISTPTGVNIFDLIKDRDGRIDGKGIIVVDMVDKCEDCVFSNPDGAYWLEQWFNSETGDEEGFFERENILHFRCPQ